MNSASMINKKGLRLFCLIFTAFANYGYGVTSIPAVVYGCYATKQECVAKLYKGVEEGKTIES